MEISKITYTRIFPLEQYTNERIGIEINVAPDDNPQKCFDLARQIVTDWHLRDEQIKQEEAEKKNQDETDAFYQLKDEINAIPFKEDAERVLKLSEFKYSPVLANIIKLKPEKNIQ